MKKFFISLFLGLFLLPAVTEASQTKLGRLYDFIYDPSYPAHQTDKNNYIQWAKENFDMHNIPLMSTKRLSFDGKVVGIDSAFKYSPLAAQGRSYAWLIYNSTEEQTDTSYSYTMTDQPEFVYNPYYTMSNVLQDPECSLGFLNLVGTGIGAGMSDVKTILDELESKLPAEITRAAVPLSIFSEFKDGSIKGSVNYKIDVPAIVFFSKETLNWSPGANGRTEVTFQVILAEGYHKYGTEEHYFIPRKYLYTGTDLGGRSTLIDRNPTTGKIDFNFPIDKSWNTKYLYVIALAEFKPLPHTTGTIPPNLQFDTSSKPNINWRFMLDAVVDRVVDVKEAPTHTPIKLELDYVDSTHKFQKVPAGTSNVPIAIKVTNPTPKIIKAVGYIDLNTSQLNGWKFTKNPIKDTFLIPAGGSTTITLTGTAPLAGSGAGAIDFYVLPIETEANENPIISNILALAVTDSVRILGLSNDSAERVRFQLPLISNVSYYNNISTIPAKYYPLIDIDQFEGYFYSHNNLAVRGTFSPSRPLQFDWVLHGNTITDNNKTLELSMYDLMDLDELKFLNSILEKNKHLALFMNRSALHSTLTTTPADLKAEYTKLFNYFGVSFKNELSRIDGTSPIVFQVKGTGDQLAKHHDTAMAIQCNSKSLISTLFFQHKIATWTPNNSKTSKVFYIDNDINAVTAVKYENGNQKRFLSGIGFGGFLINDLLDKNATLVDNILSWWLGKKIKLNPKITIENSNIDFDTVNFDEGDTPKQMKIPVSNLATDPQDVLTIFASSGFENLYDESFTVIKPLKNEIKPGETDTLIIEFNPQAELEYDITYKIMSNDPLNGTYNLYLHGVGIMAVDRIPDLILANSSDVFHTFGDVSQNTTLLRKEYYLYNQGALSSTISSIEFSPETDTDIFSFNLVSSLINKEIPQYETVLFELVMTPTKPGDFEGKIIINCNNIENPTIELEFYVHVEPVSINEEVARMFSCNVSPNPASTDIITVDFEVIGELSRNVELNIIDNSGRLVKTIVNKQYTPGNHKEPVDISKLPTGVYYIEYTVDEKTAASAITITR